MDTKASAASGEPSSEPAGDWKRPWDGGCRCGAVRFRIVRPPLLFSVCHCRMETQTDEKLPWVTTPAPRSFPRFPGEEAYAALADEHRTRGARPR